MIILFHRRDINMEYVGWVQEGISFLGSSTMVFCPFCFGENVQLQPFLWTKKTGWVTTSSDSLHNNGF